MRRLHCRSFAKLNLHLAVRGRRADGYHELETLFQSIDLHDEIELELVDGVSSIEILEGEAPGDEHNLALRAAHLLYAHLGVPGGVRLRLRKRIPAGGGLGGGSSNAATTLWALRQLLAPALPDGELRELASRLGADVPYFLVGGTVWGTGRGDELRPLPDLEGGPFWIAVAPVEVSTAAVFAALGELTPREVPSSIARLVEPDAAVGEIRMHAERLEGFNDLESGVLRDHPLIQETRDALLAAGASPVRMSGSGATLFSYFARPLPADELSRRLPAGTRVQRAHLVSRSAFEAGRVIDSSGRSSGNRLETVPIQPGNEGPGEL